MFPRVSPDGERVAFSDMGVHFFVVDRAGHATPTGKGVWEYAWSPLTGEILYVSVVPGSTELRSYAIGGKDRLLTTLAGRFTIYDVSSNGAILIGQVTGSDQIFASVPGEARDRPLFDDAALEDVSASGDLLTFTRADVNVARLSAFLGKTDGSPAKRLGSLGGFAGAVLTPDGKYVLGENSPDGLTVMDADRAALILVPTGAGETIPIAMKGISNPKVRGFSPDARQVFVGGAEPEHRPRVWTQDLAGGSRRPVTPEGVRAPCVSPDGRFIVGFESDGWTLYTADSGTPRKASGVLPGEEPIQWTADSRLLYVRGADELRPGDRFVSARVYRVDPWTGRRELWKEIAPIAPSTGGGIGKIGFSADGKICLYTHHRFSSELFVVRGLRWAVPDLTLTSSPAAAAWRPRKTAAMRIQSEEYIRKSALEVCPPTRSTDRVSETTKAFEARTVTLPGVSSSRKKEPPGPSPSLALCVMTPRPASGPSRMVIVTLGIAFPKRSTTLPARADTGPSFTSVKVTTALLGSGTLWVSVENPSFETRT